VNHSVAIKAQINDFVVFFSISPYRTRELMMPVAPLNFLTDRAKCLLHFNQPPIKRTA